MIDIFVRILNPVLMILLALGVGMYAASRYRADWRLYRIGAITFIGAQVLHIPFNAWVLSPGLNWLGITPQTAAAGSVLLGLLAAAYGLSAGLFEEVARYIVYRRWLKVERRWQDGVMFGAGHGGIEALVLGILGLYTAIQLVALRGADISAMVAPENVDLARAQVEAFWSMPWYTILLGAVERAAAVSLHIAAALMVLQAVSRKNIRWLWAAVGYHALLDAVAVFGVQTWGIYITEVAIVLFGLFGVWVAVRLRRPEPAAKPLPSPALIDLSPTGFSDDQIDKSRYEDTYE